MTGRAISGSCLEFCVARCSREHLDVSDVAHACQVHEYTVKAKAEAGVLDSAESAQVEVPVIVILIESHLPDPLQQLLIVLSELTVMKIREKHQPPCTSVKLRAPDHILRDSQGLPLPGRLKKACREDSRSGRTDAKQRRLTEACVA